MTYENSKIFYLMQVNDSVFPIGGYTQSYGLETYILKDLVKKEKEVLDYVVTNLKTSFTYSELLVASKAYDYALENNLGKIKELDEIMICSKTPREIREASHKLGIRFIKTVDAINNIPFESEIFNVYAKELKNKTFMPNHSVAYGVFSAALGVDKKTALSFFTYAASSAMVTNCVKTVPLSQTVGQQILFSLSSLYNEIIEYVLGLDESYLGLSMPGFDIRCMEHEVLYSRLYMS